MGNFLICIGIVIVVSSILIIKAFSSSSSSGIGEIINYTIFAGLRGEHTVNRELLRLGGKYIVLNDLMLRTAYGTCQIDHVVLSPYGIFVVETKNISGKITGNDEWKEWYWVGKDFNKTIYNPVMQNFRHIDVLSDTLGLSADNFISIIVFTGKAHIRVETSHAVMFLGQLVPFIKLFRYEYLSGSTIFQYRDKLQKCNITDPSEREKHVTYAKKIKSNGWKRS